MTIDFKAWPKIARLTNEHMTITEKIDGTNACVIILPYDPDHEAQIQAGQAKCFGDESTSVMYTFAVQSRKRMIYPGKDTDNAGFAAWAWEHAQELIWALGFGYHYGEWYGRGIQRGYGMMEKRFALFNPWRYDHISLGACTIECVPQLEVVPVLYEGPACEGEIEKALTALELGGSLVAPGEKAEGVIVQYKLSGSTYKAFVDDDGIPKSLKEH